MQRPAARSQKADKKIMRFCQQYVDKEKYEDELVDAIRYADPGISIQREFCYSHHKECKTRDIEGGQLVAPVSSDRPLTWSLPTLRCPLASDTR